MPPLASVTVDFPSGTRDVVLWPGEGAHELALRECATWAPLLSESECLAPVASALRAAALRALENASAPELAGIDVQIDGVAARRFTVLEGMLASDAAALFCAEHAPANEACARELARAVGAELGASPRASPASSPSSRMTLSAVMKELV